MQDRTLFPILETYCRRGWKLHPCRGKGSIDTKTGEEKGAKTPFLKWREEATSSPSKIAAWIRQFPGAMWGCATGAASGFWALDLDRGHNGDVDGVQGFKNYCKEHGYPLPVTLSQRTASGGVHLLFKMPEEGAIRNKVSFMPGIDIRGEGGYIIIPPSRNQETGKLYEWIDARRPIEDAPQWLMELVLQEGKQTPAAAQNTAQAGAQAAFAGEGSAYGLKALLYELDVLRNAAQGTRNDTLNRCAVKLFALAAGGELDADNVTRALEEAALAIGLQNGEVRATLDSARKAGYASPRKAPEQAAQAYAHTHTQETRGAAQWEPPIDFSESELPMLDTEKIPPLLGRYVDGMAEALQVPKELVFGLCLACISTAAALRFKVLVKENYAEPLNTYVLCPLDPGNRKSATVAAVSSPLRLWEASQKEKLAPVIREATSKRLTLEKAIAVKRDKAAKATDPAELEALQAEIWGMEESLPVIPRVPRLLADNVTPEALASLMAEMKECISILTAEGGIFDILAGMYSQKTPNLDLFLKAHTGGDAFRVDRKKDAPIILENPLLTLGISPQPVTLAERSASRIFRARGLDARFLYFMPKSLLGRRKLEPENLNPAIKAEWEAFILSLLPAEWTEEPEEKTALLLEDDAYKAWLEFSAAVEKELAEGGEFSSMTDWAAKLPGAVIRIAGLYHLATATTPEQVKISASTMKQAVYMGAFLAEHAKAAYALMGTDERTEGAKKVLSWLRREALSLFTTQQCWQATKSYFHHMEPLREALKEMEERNFIRELAIAGSTTAGRRPSPSYMVNPLALKG